MSTFGFAAIQNTFQLIFVSLQWNNFVIYFKMGFHSGMCERHCIMCKHITMYGIILSFSYGISFGHKFFYVSIDKASSQKQQRLDNAK